MTQEEIISRNKKVALKKGINRYSIIPDRKGYVAYV